MSKQNPLPNPILAQRAKISDTIKGIALRTIELNPVHPHCMVDTLDFLEMGDIKLAIEFFFQNILNPQDWLIDVRLHDLIYMIHIASLEGADQYSLRKFQSYLEDEVLAVYS